MDRNAPIVKPLTNREKDIVALLAKGKTNKEIGNLLNLSEGTVKVYVSRIKLKDPTLGNRGLLVRHMLRDHERQQAIRLHGWRLKHFQLLTPEAAAELDTIISEQVSALLV